MTNDLLTRAQRLQLHGLVAQWAELRDAAWLEPLLAGEEHERARRSQERRLRTAQLGRFKPVADFDWTWPTQCARNLAHQAVLAGHTVRFTTAAAMLNDLAAQDGDLALKRRLNRYVRPSLLVVDEVGYLAYGNRHADLLFEIVSRRYEQKSTVVTTNRPFAEWGEVFPNAPCVVSLIDRLIHHAEIIAIEGGSYRLKEARERAERHGTTKPAKTALRTRRSPTETPPCTTP